jgi:hypothetical protein
MPARNVAAISPGQGCPDRNVGLLDAARNESRTDKRGGVNDENPELKIHFPFVKIRMCCQGRNSSDR